MEYGRKTALWFCSGAFTSPHLGENGGIDVHFILHDHSNGKVLPIVSPDVAGGYRWSVPFECPDGIITFTSTRTAAPHADILYTREIHLALRDGNIFMWENNGIPCVYTSRENMKHHITRLLWRIERKRLFPR